MEAAAYSLYLPPTPIKPRFVLLEESTKTFYDVDTVTARLENPESWRKDGLSHDVLGKDLAIVIPNRLSEYWKRRLVIRGLQEDFDRVLNPDFEIGLLVSVQRQEGAFRYAKVLGKVNMAPLKPSLMSFAGIKEMKGKVMADELKNGLLGKLYGGIGPNTPFVHPDILQGMPRRWHIDASALNFELDGIFAAGLVIDQETTKWILRDENSFEMEQNNDDEDVI